MNCTRTLLASLPCLLLLACPSDDSGSTTEPEAGTETDGDGDGDPSGDGDGDPSGDGDGDPSGDGDGDPSGDGDGDPGTCYDIFDDIIPPVGLDCGLPQPCETATFATNNFCEVMAVYQPDVGQCILDALALGELGAISVRDCPGGQFSESWSVQMFGDGTALWRRSEFQDIGGEGRLTWRALPEPAYFEGCSADTPEALVACIEGITNEECQLGEPTCP